QGWSQTYQIENKLADVWRKTAGDADLETLVPTTRDAADYAERVARILSQLSRTEGRSQLDLWTDLISVSSDLFTVRVDPSGDQQGVLPADVAKAVIDGSLGILMSSACSAVAPKPYFRTRKPGEAATWVEGVKMGLTRPGSYVFVFIVDVPDPGLQSRDALETISLNDAPFNRKVLGKASQGLEAVRTAAQQQHDTQSFDGFLRGVDQGVSANLCDALESVLQPDDIRLVDFTFSWSLRAAALEVPRRVELSTSIVETISRASELLKAEAPPEEMQIEGYVTKLVRAQDVHELGEVTVDTLLDEGPRKVVIQLPRPAYEAAVDAHKRKRKIVCSGKVAKSGARFTLEEPHDFHELS
ncbi:MAG: hypothetical protein ACRD6W_03950, partial [Nitrososphaerales archaeon]